MRGRSRRKKRTGKMVSLQKRFLAFMLAFAMIFTNVGTDLHVSFAASGNKVDFTIGGADLVDAIRQAIEDENVVSQDSLDFTDGATEKFEALFFGDGKVYEVYPDIQGDSMEAELRVFVKLPADADDTYMVTGEEEVYFLYVNNGEDTISCSTTVTRTENGKEKEKTEAEVTEAEVWYQGHEPCMKGAYEETDLAGIFPAKISSALVDGMEDFNKKIRGFSHPLSILSGVESRTSSPVRIVRDSNSLESVIGGLYPCGEGAGYAGGITSAAADGIKIAEKIRQKYAPFL